MVAHERKWLIFYGSFLILLVVGFSTGLLQQALSVVDTTLTDTLYRRPFDSTAWKNNRSARVRMVDNLLEGSPFVEMTRRQILDILGEPDIGNGRLAGHNDLKPHMEWLRPQPPYWDEYCAGARRLIIDYDRKGRVTSIRVSSYNYD